MNSDSETELIICVNAQSNCGVVKKQIHALS